jgi:hypothetical protein
MYGMHLFVNRLTDESNHCGLQIELRIPASLVGSTPLFPQSVGGVIPHE